MIERYQKPVMAAIWSPNNRFETWALVETCAAKAQGASERITATMANVPVPTAHEVAMEEGVTRHDVVAFLNLWRYEMPPDVSAWVHLGMTSSDLVDSATGVLLTESWRQIDIKVKQLSRALSAHAVKHWDTQRVARTHGQHAEASSWGWRVADLVLGLNRAERRWEAVYRAVAVGKMSGPVGDYKRVSVREEQNFVDGMGLYRREVATQVLLRDGYVQFVNECAQLAGIVEALAMEIRLGQRTEVGELAEGFKSEQRGSSAMPHKRNPITSEQLCGLAKLVRAQVVPVMEGVALHHERDMSHSSVERIALPTAACLTHYMLDTAIDLIVNLNVDTARMAHNITLTRGEINSAAYKDGLIREGVNPVHAWTIVGNAAANLRESTDQFNTLEQELQAEYKRWRDRDEGTDLPDVDWAEVAWTVDHPETRADRLGWALRTMVHLASRPDPEFVA